MTSPHLETPELFSVAGTVAVITGGGSGLGLMMANVLARNGAAKVYIVGRDEEKLRRASTSIITPLPGDVTCQESLKQIAQHVRDEVGHINLLIPNAGITGPGTRAMSPRTTIKDFVESAWDTPMPVFSDVYNTNCTSVYYTILAFLDLLGEGNARRKTSDPKSQVIATSSMVAYQRDPRYGFAYCSSKAALNSMIKCFATHAVQWDIRFNAIAPGLFHTSLSEMALLPFRTNRDKEMTEEGAFAKQFIPAERAGSEDDIAGMLLFLASRAGAYINGSIMLIDGGRLATVPATY